MTNKTGGTPKTSLRYHPRLRAFVENPYIQTASHAAGGFGFGLLVAPFAPAGAGVVVAILLMAVAIIGHYIAVWSDPDLHR